MTMPSMDDAEPLSTPSVDAPITLPATATETTPERPWPVRHLSPKIGEYVAKMAPVWVEGQILNVKQWKHLVFLTLRDTDENMSLRATVPVDEVARMGIDLKDGARVVIHAKPQWWVKNGDLQMVGREIQSVGLGDLLARIEALKTALAREGLFDEANKRPLPFLPRRVGLICATQGDAEHDVVENAQRRWPAVQFEIRRVTVQGARAVPETIAAMRELDGHPEVDIIVVARGGGSLEDLLPFSDEVLVRAAAAVTTPLVSAIGHEKDSPLLDLVADYRASTPTDAGKRIVPDVALERAFVAGCRELATAALSSHIARESHLLAQMRSRPVLSQPLRMLDPHRNRLVLIHRASGAALVATMNSLSASHRERAASLRALSPQSTLDRGYAVVRDAQGVVVRQSSHVKAGEVLSVRLADGDLSAKALPPAQP